MTKEEFYKEVNRGYYPKYVLKQIKESRPKNDCVAVVCTKSGSILLAKYENGEWLQACFTSTSTYGYSVCVISQEVYYTPIQEDVVYWTDGEPKDYSRKQSED